MPENKGLRGRKSFTRLALLVWGASLRFNRHFANHQRLFEGRCFYLGKTP